MSRMRCGSIAASRWNAKKEAYDVWMNGRQARDTDPPKVQRASTVIVQYVTLKDSHSTAMHEAAQVQE